MSYATYDFSESIARESINREDIDHVEAAWGLSGNNCEWEGGFVIRMKDGRRLYLTGWCDTTGWGCQDGTFLEVLVDDGLPDRHFGRDKYDPDPGEWELDPADLNRFVKTGEGKLE